MRLIKAILDRKRYILILAMLIGAISLSACAGIGEKRNAARKTEQGSVVLPSSEKQEQVKSEAICESTEPEETGAKPEESPEETEAEPEESLKESPKESPAAYTEADSWYSYEMDDDFVYAHDFMASRDGQGYHWWIYLETACILRDYGRRSEYDFMLDHWTVERIYPINGGYYNIVLSQNEHDVSMDLLCHPDKAEYIVLYAQYEGGDRITGINEIPYASQLEWDDFDFHESYDVPDVENPFEDICEASVSIVLYIPLCHIGQETGYDGAWRVRELFGRSPFFDYLVENENGTFWFCVDIGQDCYTYVSFQE